MIVARTVSLSFDEKASVLPDFAFRRILHEMPWLQRPLVKTAWGIKRLREWVSSGGLDRARLSADAVRAALGYWGDVQMLTPIVEAVCCMAPPAMDYIVTNTMVIGTGWSTSGWTGGLPKFETERELIILSGSSRDPRKVLRTMLHEAAHVWLEPPSLPQLKPCTVGTMLDVEPERKAYEESDPELRAEALAAIWKFTITEKIQ